MERLWWEPGAQLRSAHHSLISLNKPFLNTRFLFISHIPPHPSPPSLCPLQEPCPVSSHCYHLILGIFAVYSVFRDRRQPGTGTGDGFIIVQAVYLSLSYLHKIPL